MKDCPIDVYEGAGLTVGGDCFNIFAGGERESDMSSQIGHTSDSTWRTFSTISKKSVSLWCFLTAIIYRSLFISVILQLWTLLT